MSENTKTAKSTKAAKPAPTWREVLAKSEVERTKSEKGKKNAGILLWDGARAAISEWLGDPSTDETAEILYNEVQTALGGSHRRGDANKIKTVALAAQSHNLDITEYPNLSRAYAAARNLTQTQVTEKAEDVAADEATQAIAEAAPKTASTAESAAMLVLSKGVDEAARLLLNALGENNDEAHRGFIRAVVQESSGRVKARAEAEKAAKQAEAEANREAKKAEAEAKKAERAAVKEAKPKPESVSKGDPNKKALPPKAKPVTRAKPAKAEAAATETETPKAKPVTRAKPAKVEAPVVEDTVAEDTVVEEAPAPKKAKPAVRRPVRRSA